MQRSVRSSWFCPMADVPLREDLAVLRRRGLTSAKLYWAGTVFQRKGLVIKHSLDHNLTSRFGIDCVLRDEVSAFDDDLIGILHNLELLEAVMLIEPHTLADDFEILIIRNGQSRSCAHISR